MLQGYNTPGISRNLRMFSTDRDYGNETIRSVIFYLFKIVGRSFTSSSQLLLIPAFSCPCVLDYPCYSFCPYLECLCTFANFYLRLRSSSPCLFPVSLEYRLCPTMINMNLRLQFRRLSWSIRKPISMLVVSPEIIIYLNYCYSITYNLLLFLYKTIYLKILSPL